MRGRDINQAEHTTYASLRDFVAAPEYPAGVLTVMDGGLPIDIRHEPNGHDTTIVFFHPAVDRAQARLPMFIGAGISKDLPANRVFVADPSLYINDSLGLAWYAGNRQQPKLQWALRWILRELIPDSQHVVMFGSSGGGFAALYYAAHRPGATAISVNPQTNIENYWPRNVQAYTRAAWGFDDIRELQKTTVATDLIPLYKQRPETHVLYIQNENDPLHIDKHYQPFIDALPQGNRVEPILFDGPDGHVPPPKEMLRDALIAAIERKPHARQNEAEYAPTVAANSFPDLDTARAFNDRLYGGPDAARALADDNAWNFCEDCHAVSMPNPGVRNDGHQCLSDGMAGQQPLPQR